MVMRCILVVNVASRKMGHVEMNPLMKLTNGGLEKEVCELRKEHLGELLRLWNMGHNALTKETQLICVDSAFGKDESSKLLDEFVQDLFKWNYLQWQVDDVSFVINPALNLRFEELTTRYRELIGNL